MKVYGAEICVDCRNYLAIQTHRGFDAEFIDITENTGNLKAFLAIRDNSPVFDEIRRNGSIGIPLFVSDDGRMTFEINEAMAWLGLPPVREEELAEGANT